MRHPLVLLLLLPSLVAFAQPPAGEDRLRFADGLYRDGIYEMAAAEYAGFLEAFPEHPRASGARLRLGDAYLQCGKYAEAAEVLAELLAREPRFPDRHEAAYRLGRALVECGRSAEAIPLLRKAQEELADRPDEREIRPRVLYWLAEAFYRNDQPAKSLAVLEHLLTTNPPSEVLHLAQYTAGWAAYRSSQPEKAVGYLQSFLEGGKDDANEAECRFVLGECLFRLARHGEALAQYSKAASQPGPYQDDAALAIGWCLFETGDFHKAGESFAAVARAFPKSEVAEEARLQAGISYLEAGELDLAHASLTAAESDPTHGPEASYYKALVLQKQGKSEKAIELLAGIRTQDGTLVERIRIASGEMHYREGRYEEALREFAHVRGEDGSGTATAYALHASSLCRQALGQHAEAIELTEELERRFPDSPYIADALIVRAESRFALEEFEAAATLLARIVHDHPDNPALDAALYKLGWSLFELGKFEEARRAFLDLGTRFPQCEFAEESAKLAAQCLTRLGRREEAIAEMRRVAKSGSPVGNQALLEVARLERDCSNAAGAIDAYDRLAAQSEDTEVKARALYEQAEVRFDTGDFANATEGYRSALQLGKDVALRRSARYGLAWALYREGEFAEAAATANELLRDEGLDAEMRASTLHLSGSALHRTGDWAGAIRSFRRLLEDHPESPLAYESGFGLAVSLAGAGEAAQAARVLERILEKYPGESGNDRVLYELAFAEMTTGREEAGVQAFERLVAEFPKSPLVPEVLFRLGEHHYEKERFADAASAYSGVLETSSGEFLDKALYKKGWSERKQGDEIAAAGTFQRLATECPKSPLRGESLFLAGECLRLAGRPKEAEKSYRTLLREYPDHELVERAHLGLGLSLVDARAWADAVPVLSEHRERYPESERLFEVDFRLGKSLQELGRYPSAIQAFRRVTSGFRGETAARAQFEIGECLFAQRDFEGALSEYLKVRYLYAHEEWVAASLFRCGQCFEKLEQTDRAAATFKELMEKYPQSEWSREAAKSVRTGSSGI